MSDREYKILCDYVRDLADRIGLKDWTILVEREPICDDGSAAGECSPTFGRKDAVIRFECDFEKKSKRKIAWIVTHELLHCHFAHHQNIIDSMHQSGIMSKVQKEMIFVPFNEALEYCLDAIAEALSKHMPPIDWEVSPPSEKKDAGTRKR